MQNCIIVHENLDADNGQINLSLIILSSVQYIELRII